MFTLLLFGGVGGGGFLCVLARLRFRICHKIYLTIVFDLEM